MSVRAKLFDMATLRRQLLAFFKRDGLPQHQDKLIKDINQLGLGQMNSTSQFVKLAGLALTIPLTVSSAERSFSALKRIKTHLIYTMADCQHCQSAWWRKEW